MAKKDKGESGETPDSHGVKSYEYKLYGSNKYRSMLREDDMMKLQMVGE